MKANAVLLFAVLLSVSAAALSGVGQACNYTNDCSTGYCAGDSKTCVNPAVSKYAVGAECNITRDCKEGYCSADKCIIPIAEAANVLAFGPKSGCAGLADATALGSLVVICDAMWVLLVIFALLAGFVARTEENKIVPVIAVLLPLLIGALIFVFVGVIIAIVEIALLFYKGERKTEYATLPKELLQGPPA